MEAGGVEGPTRSQGAGGWDTGLVWGFLVLQGEGAARLLSLTQLSFNVPAAPVVPSTRPRDLPMGL